MVGDVEFWVSRELLSETTRGRKMLYKQPNQSQAMVMNIRKMEDVGQLTPQKKELIPGQLCLGQKDEVFIPIYFGVACALSAVNLLGTRMNGQKMVLGMNGSSKAIEKVLTGATQLLGLLVWKAQSLLGDKKDAAEAWELEKIAMLNNVAKAKTEVAEMKKQRAEDAKANEKVVAMFAAQEQNWKNERKNLKQQFEALLKDLQAVQAHTQMAVLNDENEICSECLLKEQRISELNDKIGEKEFLMMDTVEAAEAERRGRNELQQKLNGAEAIVEELKEKLSKETEEREAEFRRHKAAFIDFVSNQRQMKVEMSQALRQLESAQRECEIILNEKKEAEALNQSLSVQIAHLEKDIQEKDEVVSSMLKISNADAEERQELEKELKISKTLRRQAELEAEKWRRECEGKSHNPRKPRWTLRSSSASRADSRSDAYTEMKRLQAEEIRSLHMKYGNQVQSLQDKIKKYEEKLTKLEESILIHLGHNERSSYSKSLEVGCSNSEGKDLAEVGDSLKADIGAEQFQFPFAKVRLIPYIDTEQDDKSKLPKWNKLYVAAKTTTEMLQRKNENPVTPSVLDRLEDWIKLENGPHPAQLEQKHWQELNAFSRQMRVKDEKMDYFHRHMMNMERDSKRLHSEIAILNHNLKHTREEKKLLESMLIEKNRDLKSLRERLNFHENENDNKIHSSFIQNRSYQMGVEAMRLEVKKIKRKLREKEREHRTILIKILEEAENELQEKDYKLAIVEAKLIQAQIQYEQEKKTKEKNTSEIMKKKTTRQDCSMDLAIEEHESCEKYGICATCLEAEELSEMISEARGRMKQMENHHEKQLKVLIEQAAKVSKTGCQLRTVKNLLHGTKEKVESSADCNMHQAVKEKRDKSMSEVYFCAKVNDIDKHVSSIVHRNLSPETCNSGNAIEHQAEDTIKHPKPQATLGGSDDCQNDPRANSLGFQTMLKNNGFSKGKAINKGQCSTFSKAELLMEEGQESQTQRQTSKETMICTKAVTETKFHGRNVTVFSDTSASLKSMLEGRDSSQKKDAEALSVSSKVEELERELEQLEKMCKTDGLELLNSKDGVPVTGHVENGNENEQMQSTWAPISAVDLLKKQVKRYQSLIAEIEDLCKRMYDKDAFGSMDSSLNGVTGEQTAAQELYLIETFQLQRHAVSTGQKLMALQRRILCTLGASDNEFAPPAVLNIRESVENAKSHLREIQRIVEVWIAKLIGDLEGTLARKGILHVMPTEWRKKQKPKFGRNKITSRSLRVEPRKMPV